MKLIVGLGNIGEKYEKTRHNAGFVVVEKLAEKIAKEKEQDFCWRENKKFFGSIFRSKNAILLKPSTFMNESGKSVAAVLDFYKLKPEDVYVVYDDLDIELGQYKIQFCKGPKVHNGLLSVREKLGTNAFWHVRVGVENRVVKGNGQIPGVEYSLQDFTIAERELFEAVVKQIVQELAQIAR